MVELRLHGEQVQTVFDLLGKKENDITYSLGWALSQSDRLATALLKELFPGSTPGELRAVRLQEFLTGGGYTDIEIESEKFEAILEAKRGWNLPGRPQLTQYAPRLHGKAASAILVVSECSPDFAHPRLPQAVDGVVVHYRSWKQMVQLVETSLQGGGHAEKRLLRELVRYLKGLMSMQNQDSNRVYVVSLGATPTPWSGPLTPIQIVTEKERYFHEVGGRYPKDPPNYVGFRWKGRLQQICHVDKYEVITDPHPHIPELPSQQWEPSYLYSLGPAIKPQQEVLMGKLYPSARVWAALDLLLTCDTIAEARDRTQEREQAAGL